MRAVNIGVGRSVPHFNKLSIVAACAVLLLTGCPSDDDDAKDFGVIDTGRPSSADSGHTQDTGASNPDAADAATQPDAGAFAGCSSPCATPIETPVCDFNGDIPTEVPLHANGSACQNRADFDQFSWQSLLRLAQPPADAAPVWEGWVSTVDMLRQNPTPPMRPTRFTPQVCRDNVPRATDFRALEQVNKINDSIFEAGQPNALTSRTGLSNDPVIAANGSFIRYEILISDSWYDKVRADGYNLNATYTNGATVTANCASSQDPWGAVNLKLAWMDVTSETTRAPGDPALRAWLDTFYKEDLLVVDPASASSTSTDTCSLRTMALVGMHLVRKTVEQPGWVWATFEHVNNAPDCMTPPPAGGGGNASPSTSCPTVNRDYTLHPMSCNGNAACAECNTRPAINGAGTSCSAGAAADGGTEDGGSGYCVDKTPAAVGGTSKICRQFPIDDCYPEAKAWNDACRASASVGAVWKNYELIGTQWVAFDNDIGNPNAMCRPSANAGTRAGGSPVFPASVRPQLGVPGMIQNPASTRPFLGNTAMESYERSNCASCHAKASHSTRPTDMSWWLELQVRKANQQ